METPALACEENLPCYCLDIRLAATTDTQLDGWIGAVLRNNLLYACEQVEITEEKKTLYHYLNTIPLKANHPLYKELENGFPPPYYLYPHKNYGFRSSTLIKKGDIVSFSLVLIGSTLAAYYRYFIEAIRIMCHRGFGVNMPSFTLIDVSENSLKGNSSILATSEIDFSNKLSFPITYSSFADLFLSNSIIGIRLQFLTPLNLNKRPRKDEKGQLYKATDSPIPGFYQLIRSVANRFLKLNALYLFPDDIQRYEALRESLNHYIDESLSCTLEEANILRVHMRANQRKDAGKCILFNGYIGQLVFQGNCKSYLPLLSFMQYLGIGHNISYGLGKYSIDIIISE